MIVGARLRAQLLTGPPARDPVAVAERIVALQGQDGRGVRLAIRARSEGLTVGDVERAMTVDRSLLITWLNRGTLHLVRSEDYPWLHALTTPPLLSAVARRLEQDGVTAAAAERGVQAIIRALGDEGPLPRTALADRVRAAGVRTDGQALVHQLVLASARGHVVRGPMVGRQHAYALVHDWLGPLPAVDRGAALGELARRYLTGHAPADERDLAKWAGVPLRDARAGLAAIGDRIARNAEGLFSLAGDAGEAVAPVRPRLLGAFDPLLHGWRDRQPITGRFEAAIVSGGIFRPFALVGGHAAALWGIERGQVRIEPLRPLSAQEGVALGQEAEDVMRYLALS